MPLQVLGECRPGKWFGCKPPLTADAVQATVETLPMFRAQDVETIIVPGQLHTPLPPGCVKVMESAFAHPDNHRYAMAHWRRLHAICVRRSALEEVIAKGHFLPPRDYAALVAAFIRTGPAVIDVEILPD